MFLCRWALSAAFAATLLLAPRCIHAGPIVTVQSGPIVFDFNGLSGQNNGQISASLTTQLGIGTVTVSGAKVERTYNADRHVTGVKTGADSVSNRTLGSTDGGVLHSSNNDFYLANNSSSDRIVMEFGGGVRIYGVSFDYQIFPNSDVANGTGRDPNTTKNWPDFSLLADGTLVFRKLAVMPADTPYPYSDISLPGGVELAPQFLGESGWYSFPQGVTRLEFVDWPKTIGIDNLALETTPPTTPSEIVPEPSSALVFTAALIGLAAARRRRIARG